MSKSNVLADSNRLSSLTAYDAVMGRSSGQTVRWGNLLLKIIESRLLPLVMEAAGRTEGYALGLRDAGVITEIQRGQMACVALTVTTDKTHRLPPDLRPTLGTVESVRFRLTTSDVICLQLTLCVHPPMSARVSHYVYILRP
jgi:hypothetical protein